MWTYLGYIINGLSLKLKSEEINREQLERFIFEILFKEQKLVFWDGSIDLWEDVKYLESLGLITIGSDCLTVIEPEKLTQIANIISKSYANLKTPLLQEYIDRIDGAITSFDCLRRGTA